MFDEKFMEYLKLSVETSSPYYSQIKLLDRKSFEESLNNILEETKKYLLQPRATELIELFNKLTIDSLLDIFKIAPTLEPN